MHSIARNVREEMNSKGFYADLTQKNPAVSDRNRKFLSFDGVWILYPAFFFRSRKIYVGKNGFAHAEATSVRIRDK